MTKKLSHFNIKTVFVPQILLIILEICLMLFTLFINYTYKDINTGRWINFANLSHIGILWSYMLILPALHGGLFLFTSLLEKKLILITLLINILSFVMNAYIFSSIDTSYYSYSRLPYTLIYIAIAVPLLALPYIKFINKNNSIIYAIATTLICTRFFLMICIMPTF